nr:amino acid adenylation domain-containing protein [uncultured Agathobaculum sp.]
MINVLEFLERTAAVRPDKPAVIDRDGVDNFDMLLRHSKSCGTALAAHIMPGTPVPVLLEKGRTALYAMFGAVYAGGFYVPLSPALPQPRLEQILAVAQAPCLVTDRAHAAQAASLAGAGRVLLVEELLQTEPDSGTLAAIRRGATDGDPLYCNFTSGSTGTPKGVVVSHRGVLDFIPHFAALFGFDAADVIGNQAPLDFDVSVKDVYTALLTGATLVLIPRTLFSQPGALMDFLCEHRVTTLTWAVSALCLVSTFHGLDYRTPETVNKVLFSGEVMPLRHLQSWMAHLPDAEFVNLYGPTEITCNCTYHRIERERNYDTGIPLGTAFPNRRVFLLDDDGHEVTAPGQPGEICVSGASLGLGYYNAPEQTGAVFVQHPANRRYLQPVYRTGDRGQWNDRSELCFLGRKDFQIKHMGHRIELEEIERAAQQLDGVDRFCCVFDGEKERLHGFYTGALDKAAVRHALAQRLPVYMLPRTFGALARLPITENGKVDRKTLLALARKESP